MVLSVAKSITRVGEHDALVIVDVQIDFLSGGALPVPHGDEVVPVLNEYIRLFDARRLPIFASRDWHPAKHCSFKAQGGHWPVHCVADSASAQFPAALTLPPSAIIISKATLPTEEAYSAFAGTNLRERLTKRSCQRLFIGGLATDYCVFNTVKDALGYSFQVNLLIDAIRAVNVRPDDGAKAEKEMTSMGAVPLVRPMLT